MSQLKSNIPLGPIEKKRSKHENEIKMKYRTYRHQYHVPYQQVKKLAVVVDPYE